MLMVGRAGSKHLTPPSSLAYKSESIRLTTRLTQLASWLLVRRAIASVKSRPRKRTRTDAGFLSPQRSPPETLMLCRKHSRDRFPRASACTTGSRGLSASSAIAQAGRTSPLLQSTGISGGSECSFLPRERREHYFLKNALTASLCASFCLITPSARIISAFRSSIYACKSTTE